MHSSFTRGTLTKRCGQLAIIGALEWRAADVFDLHPCNTVALKSQKLRGSNGNINEAISDVRAAIIDPDHNGAPVRKVGDAYVGRQRQRGMCCRNRIHIEDFAIGGVAAMKVLAIPGCKANGTVVDILFGHIESAADRIGLSDAVDTTALRDRLPGLNNPRACRHAVARIDLSRDVAVRAIGHRQ